MSVEQDVEERLQVNRRNLPTTPAVLTRFHAISPTRPPPPSQEEVELAAKEKKQKQKRKAKEKAKREREACRPSRYGSIGGVVVWGFIFFSFFPHRHSGPVGAF